MQESSTRQSRAGTSLTVEPFRSVRDIMAVKEILASHPRDLLLFVLAINSPLHMPDLLNLRRHQLQNVSTGSRLLLRDSRTGRTVPHHVTDVLYKAILGYLIRNDHNDDSYVFRSRNGDNVPLSTDSVAEKLRSWCKTARCRGRLGVPSLRKTFGYMHFLKGTSIRDISRLYGHGSPEMTTDCLGLDPGLIATQAGIREHGEKRLRRVLLLKDDLMGFIEYSLAAPLTYLLHFPDQAEEKKIRKHLTSPRQYKIPAAENYKDVRFTDFNMERHLPTENHTLFELAVCALQTERDFLVEWQSSSDLSRIVSSPAGRVPAA